MTLCNFTYLYHIIWVLSYVSQNDWLKKGVQDTVSMYHIEVQEFSNNGHQSHGFVKIGSLVIELVKKTMRELELKQISCTFFEKKQYMAEVKTKEKDNLAKVKEHNE